MMGKLGIFANYGGINVFSFPEHAYLTTETYPFSIPGFFTAPHAKRALRV